jgi:hypothetical protein
MTKEIKPTHSTVATRYSDARTTRYRQYLDLVKTYADDIGEPNAGQQTLLAMLEVPLRTLQDIREKLDTQESTLKDGRANDAIVKDFSKIADLSMRLIKEFYALSNKKATNKRLKPIIEIIEGDK